MSRIEEILKLVEAGETVDCEKFKVLLALDCAKTGEEFVDEILSIMREGEIRYRRMKRFVRQADGSIELEFYSPKELENGGG